MQFVCKYANPIKIAYMQLLNNLSPAQFLAEYWQKKPLLIRGAMPDFKGLLNPNELAGLACEENVQARIIQQKKQNWTVKNGPFDDADFAKLPKKDWTLLVQSVNHYLPEAAELLTLFNFIPHARLDDLMVSYAPDGGGVGAHFDSYDVFLLQGSGRRNWKISAQKDLTLLENQPIKVLKNFNAEQEWTLEAGDMLYLPPHIAHWGVAIGDDCMTYSIGFRAPKMHELQHEFLSYLQDNLNAEGLYEDADLTLQEHPAEISENMLKKVGEMLKEISWSKDNIADFLGKYLTEPKPDVCFEPHPGISIEVFAKELAHKILYLSLKSQLLFYDKMFYLNGEKLDVLEDITTAMRELSDKRSIATGQYPRNLQDMLINVLYAPYLAGFVTFEL